MAKRIWFLTAYDDRSAKTSSILVKLSMLFAKATLPPHVEKADNGWRPSAAVS